MSLGTRQPVQGVWIESDDEAQLEAFKKRKYQFMAKDREGRDVFLADSNYVLQMAQNDSSTSNSISPVNFKV